ncbi:MAG TPA: PSD1 and planctomycete cytochrome C domain-containing protein, partial [Arenibacter sp.]|nr:PSD1 and planctomycete cytochrome C domain-containing protein [Arenibacter sp.]
MKQKGIILSILLGLTALVFALRSRLFQGTDDEYEHQKMPDLVDYNFHIKPILSDNCYTCHGPDAGQRKGGFRLDLEEEAFLELPENPGKYAIVAGNPGRSLLYRHVVSDDPKEIMPPVDSQLKLSSHEKKLLKKWIEQGAKFEKHWAYIPPKKVELPKIEETDRARNEIDYFILEKLEEYDLSPSERAADGTLMRRIALDLTGLPPSVEQVEKYLSDGNGLVPERVIDEFLASPAYGERMAQVWMDVARYADSHGYQDDSYRSMWPWRDWVIHAFNENLPYDEFLVEQLAGDLLPNATRDQILATGFNRNHPITQEGGVIQEEYQSYYVADRTNTLGTAILGLTLECAKCHDHKYDALSQREYFELYAFFNNVAEKGLQMDAVQASWQKYYADAPYMAITDEEADGVLSFINKKEEGEIKVMVMNDSMPRQTYVFNRGEYYDLGEEVGPDTPEAIFPYSDKLPKNRLGLAKWVTDENNPLTARVYVNRIWAMLFGKGLVATPEDFGVQGSLPTHPQLLDWLSRDFMDHGWDIK